MHEVYALPAFAELQTEGVLTSRRDPLRTLNQNGRGHRIRTTADLSQNQQPDPPVPALPSA